MNKLFWPLLFALSLLAPAVFAGDFTIVPGKRVGSVALGMSRAAVHARLHAPSTIRRVQGMILDTWLSPAPLPRTGTGRGNYLKHDYLTVFFQQDRAVQIEVSSPQFKTAAGLSINSSVYAFGKQYPQRKMPRFPRNDALRFWNSEYLVGAEGMPAPKHFVFYGEALDPSQRRAVTLGLAWKYSAWGALAPEPDEDHQETVVVYLPGNEVQLNPNDGLWYSGTESAQE